MISSYIKVYSDMLKKKAMWLVCFTILQHSLIIEGIPFATLILKGMPFATLILK